jgi:RNA polymerase sigma-70 factor, ECF subfamily
MRGEPVFDELLAEELPRLRAFVRAHLSPQLRLRESSSDLVQSVCRSLLIEKDHFEFRGEAQFRAWLFTIARHKIAEKLRFHMREMRDMRRDEGLDPSSATAILSAYQTTTTPSHVAEAREQVAKLEQAIDLLEPDHREVVTLVRLAGLPYAEAAEVIGRTAEATRMLLGRALIRLAAALRQVGLSGDTQPPS